MPQSRNYEQEDLEEIRFLSIHLENWKFLSIDASMANKKEAKLYKEICKNIQECLDTERMWYARFHNRNRKDGTSIRLFEKN